MKVAEAVQNMSIIYLNRIIDSFTRDFPKQGVEEARDTIIKNVNELANTRRIRNLLRTFDELYDQQILQNYILESLLNSNNHLSTEDEIRKNVESIEKRMLDEATDENCFQYTDQHSLEVLKTVLKVALEDEKLSSDELKLIKHLREKLDLNIKEQHLILAQLGHYPKEGNELHTSSEINNALAALQKRGVVFFCNKFDKGACYVIPDEIVEGVKSAIGFELNQEAYKLLLGNLQVTQMRDILENKNIKKSGKKEDLINRILHTEISPSETLGLLSNDELYDLCKSLPGANVSGTKEDKIKRIINYFTELKVKDIAENSDPREVYYDYLIELANRDRKNLLSNKVIKKDRDMEKAFEEGTRFLFEQKFNLQLLGQIGSENPDGALKFGDNELLMWDNKGKEDIYRFPNSHLRQFKRYIRDSTIRVSCFLIIVPDISEDAEKNAYKLKVDSKSDTDIALITAEELKWTSESWQDYSNAEKFDVEVFNITGILDRQTLTKRMKLLLN